MTATASWTTIARDENLLDGLGAADLAKIEHCLALLPDDPTKIIFLRWANESNILASSPHMTSIVLVLTFMARILGKEIDAANARGAETQEQNLQLLERLNEAIRAVGESAIQIVDRTTHLRGFTEQATTKMDAIASSLPTKFDAVVRDFEQLLKAAAETKAKAATDEVFTTTFQPKVEKVSADLDTLAKDLTLIASHLEPFALQIRTVLNAEPLVISGIKLNRMTATVGAVFLVIGLALGSILTLLIAKPAPVVLTPAMIRMVDQGAAYAKVWPYLSRGQQAAIERALAQPAPTPTPIEGGR